jgi:hypothetical protein
MVAQMMWVQSVQQQEPARLVYESMMDHWKPIILARNGGIY